MEIADGIALWSAARTRETVIVTVAGREGQLRGGNRERKASQKEKRETIQGQY